MSVTLPVTMGPQIRLDVVEITVDQWAGTVDEVVIKDGVRIGYNPMTPDQVRAKIAELTAALTTLTMWEDSALNDPLDDDIVDALAAAWAEGAMTP